MVEAHCKTIGTHEDERTLLFKTISLDGIKPNTKPKTNPNPNTSPNPNPKLTVILTLFSCFMLFRAPSSDLQSSRTIPEGCAYYHGNKHRETMSMLTGLCTAPLTMLTTVLNKQLYTVKITEY